MSDATCEKSSAVGNEAAMREALEKFNAVDLSGLEFPLDGDSSTIYNSNKKEITIPYWRVAELLNGVKDAQDMAKAVLAKPPRNCDRFATLDDARNAFFADYVPDGTCSSSTAFAIWLFDEVKGAK